MKDTQDNKKKPSFFARLYNKAMNVYEYCTVTVWRSSKHTPSVMLIKTVNLSVKSFMDRDLQNKSTSLTYSSVLAIVPALALIFAICRGFGFQNLLQSVLYEYFPSQRKMIETVLTFVDSYLNQASQGIFVGVGLVMLLWTLVSLLSNIEVAFNNIWDIKRDRSFFQKLTSYISLCLMVPVLIICSSGLSIFMSTTLADHLNIPFLTPVINVVLELSPLVLVWIAFSLSYLLIPNTKVQFKYAAISGAICAIMFQVLQLLFVTGQLYVSKYNAIYGSFSFLPLLLVWLQLSWLILLFGCVLTYSLQNVFAFNYLGNVTSVSFTYMRKITVAVAAIITQRFMRGEKPLTRNELSTEYDIPVRLLGHIINHLKNAGFINYVIISGDSVGVAPAKDPTDISAGDLFKMIDNVGESDFIPNFKSLYSPLLSKVESALLKGYEDAGSIMLKDLELPDPKEIKSPVNFS